MNHFRLRRLIGRGGMGEVYEADALISGAERKPVALKVMRSDLREQARYTKLFHREARINLDISHEHAGMVTVFGHFEDSAGQLYIVMDLIRGCSLHALLKEYRCLPTDLIVYIAAQMLDAIAHMHGLGYLHLDLSPSNVLLTNDGRVKISDLGLAKAAPEDGAPSSHIAKPPYASPEVLRAGTVDVRSDLYSFAAIVYQMAMGTPPYGHKHDIQHVMARLANWQPPPLDGLPAELRTLIGDLFHEDPDMRSPQSAQAGRDTLPAIRTMQHERAQLVAMVEPLYQREHRASLRERVPQLCFDVPVIVEPGSAGMLDDTEPDGDTNLADLADADAQADGTTDSVDGMAEASMDVSGLHWAPEGAGDGMAGSARPYSTVDADTNRVRVDGWASETGRWPAATPEGLDARNDGRFVPADPARVGCGHDTSTARHTIRQVFGILPTKEVANGMSIEDPTTRFLDALRAWYEANKAASGDEVTVAPMTDVRKEYHKLDSKLQDQTVREWSLFLQVCQIRPPNHEWIWESIETLAVALGCCEDDDSLARWINHIAQKLKYRSANRGAQRFLDQLDDLVVGVPVLRQDGFVVPRDESLPILEHDITLLFRFHDALSDADKEAIEHEWQELKNAISSYNETRQRLHSLYDRIAEKLGYAVTTVEDATTAPIHKIDGKTRLTIVRADSDSGEIAAAGEPRVQVRQSSADRGDAELIILPTLPATQGEAAVAWPALLPEDESRRWNKSRARRVGAIGGTIVAVATIVMFVLLPEPQPLPKIAVTEQPAIPALPVTSYDYPICEAPEKSNDRQAPAIAAPTRRIDSKIQLLDGADSVILKRKNKPNLKLTVTEVADDGTPLTKAEKAPKRTYAIDAGELTNQGLTLGVNGSDDYDELLQIVVERGPGLSP